ncbi:MAG TPA: Asp-tRNA(Asn)/Glu-tRNA(Gln) amidotransferase subunit GatA [Verrucomicrobiota bacterium]|nr:Asp-tRNA(Asn)/Glu-tRNA(Gln) amidotransferase subunit GatA [Verrucomicrobiota bacterium]HRT10680.1 Asp-tRNA(Asn)/Glu-tRNA(Gln) amidotransferase subunit GatA [Candidatus Paceibacterota bacterium]HRT56588.1 Asp-tRNA(Asn)/Glu-tRNA(Gln) amidotransferase subunit GatA [Candidatus Paceibacterota bacterium]
MRMLNRLTISELVTRLASREVSSRAATQACLDQIERLDGRLHAFISLDADHALAQADAADRALAAGTTHAQQPLLGVPIGIKDVIAVKGQPLNCASKILGRYVSPYNATVINKLQAAGAVVFGRLNMDEFAMGSSTENSAFGVTRNPWDLSRIPGGSSGGSGAAVVADECIAALGSDTGGSIRQPAALCGCVGLKPSYGRVSRYGLVAYASSLDQIGCFSKNVRDAAILLEILSGVDPADSTSVPQPVPHYAASLTGDVKGLRLGLAKEYMVGGLDAEIKAAIDAAVAQFEKLGARVTEVSLPHTDYAIATYYIIATAEASANLARFDGIRYGLRVEGADPIELYSKTRGAGFGPEVKRRIILGTYVLSSGYYDAYYLRAQKVRTLIRRDFLKAFEQVDAILTPTTPTPAFKIGEKADDPLQMYLSDIFTISANLAGICGISVPCGFTREPKLPIGLQLLGKPFGEETLLRLAHAYEQSTPWHKEKPPLAAPAG